MFSEFPDWFKLANLTTTNEEIRQRWDAIAKIAPSMDLESVRIGIAFLANQRADDFGSWSEGLVGQIRAAGDASHPSDGNMLELQLSTSAALYCVMTETELSLTTSLALGVANFLPVSPSVFLEPLAQFARQVVRNAAVANRKRSNDRAALSFEASEPTQTSTNSDLRKVMEEVNRAVKELERMIGLRAEETDLMWWLVTGYSGVLERFLKEGSPSSAAIAAAIEVRSLITAIPGPAKVKGIIEAAITNAGLDPSRQLSLKEFVKDAGADALAHVARVRGKDSWRQCVP